MHTLGTHYLLEISGCPFQNLNDRNYVERTLLEAAETAGATIVTSAFHTFSPHGVSGVVVIAESHLTIHTWPELGYAALDVFTCGDEAMPEKAVKYCIDKFGATMHSYIEVKRGIMDDRTQSASCFLSIQEGRGASL